MPLRAIISPSAALVFRLSTYIGAAMVTQGVCILNAPSAKLVSQLAWWSWALSFVSPSSELCGWLLIAFGAMAIIAGNASILEAPTRLWLLVPQQVVLVFVALSIADAILDGKFPDGYVPVGGSSFILADQPIAWIICVMLVVEFLALAIRSHRET